jgi:uncharacterized RDD family membrane protein YckC
MDCGDVIGDCDQLIVVYLEMDTYDGALEHDESAQSQVASTTRRFVAFIIDVFIIGILESLIRFGVRFFGGDGFESGYGARLFEFLVSMAYFTHYDSVERSGTFGKQVMGIMVVDEQGHQLEQKQSAWRTFIKIITGWTVVLWLVPIFTKHRQSIHDFAAKTYVIKL